MRTTLQEFVAIGRGARISSVCVCCIRATGMSSLAARAYMKGEKAKHELRRKMEGVCFQNKTAEERGEGREEVSLHGI